MSTTRKTDRSGATQKAQTPKPDPATPQKPGTKKNTDNAPQTKSPGAGKGPAIDTWQPGSSNSQVKSKARATLKPPDSKVSPPDDHQAYGLVLEYPGVGVSSGGPGMTPLIGEGPKPLAGSMNDVVNGIGSWASGIEKGLETAAGQVGGVLQTNPFEWIKDKIFGKKEETNAAPKQDGKTTTSGTDGPENEELRRNETEEVLEINDSLPEDIVKKYRAFLKKHKELLNDAPFNLDLLISDPSTDAAKKEIAKANMELDTSREKYEVEARTPEGTAGPWGSWNWRSPYVQGPKHKFDHGELNWTDKDGASHRVFANRDGLVLAVKNQHLTKAQVEANPGAVTVSDVIKGGKDVQILPREQLINMPNEQNLLDLDYSKPRWDQITPNHFVIHSEKQTPTGKDSIDWTVRKEGKNFVLEQTSGITKGASGTTSAVYIPESTEWMIRQGLVTGGTFSQLKDGFYFETVAQE